MGRKQISFSIPWPTKQSWPLFIQGIRSWLPSRGNVIFTSLAIVSLVWATKAGAVSLSGPAATDTSAITIPYQGRLADASGTPLNDSYILRFALYPSDAINAPMLWSEVWIDGVHVSDGLFNVMIGSITPIPQSVITENSNLWLGIKVGDDDEMRPRVQLGSVPFAVQALTVKDGSVTTTKLVDGSVTAAKLSDGAVTSTKLEENLNLNGDLTVNGQIKDVTGYVAPVGTIAMYAGTTAPEGWLLCDGSPLSRTAYQNLFAVIGTTFGNGDGSATFNLPDLRGRTPFGKAASGTFQTLGATGGVETHSHTVAIAGHAHNLPFSHSNGRLYVMWAGGTDEHFRWSEGHQGGDQPVSEVAQYSGVQTWCCGSGQNYAALTSTSGGQTVTSSANSNVPPFAVVNYIIKR